MDMFETMPGKPPFQRRLPSWARMPKDLLGNLVWLSDLFVSNRARLEDRIGRGIIKSALDMSSKPPAPARRPVPYRQVQIAGDGRCGFRSILASRNLHLYEKVARTKYMLAKP